MLIISQNILSRSVTRSSVCILGKSILVSMYRIDFIGAGICLKADSGVRGVL